MRTLRTPPKLTAFLAAREGNVAVIFALASTMLMIAAGAGIDYAVAAKAKTELQAIADAAALAALTPAMYVQSQATAKSAVKNAFAAQAQLVKGFTYSASGLAVTVTDSPPSVSKTRTVTISYSGEVPNAFGGFYKRPYTSFVVSSTAGITQAPNIDFYLLLDNSPSMELPATQTGLNAMFQNTGCYLACHEQNYKDSEYTVHYPGWGTMDSYTYAENSGITLRLDNVRLAAQNLVSTALTTATANGAAYRMAAYDFNYQFNTLQSLTTISSATQPSLISNIGSMTPPLMSGNNSLAGNQSYIYPINQSTYRTVELGSSGVGNGDAMTDFNMALTNINGLMPNPGNGTNTQGDTPQEILLIVTDGVDDAALYWGSSCSGSVTTFSNSYGNFYRCEQPANTTLCSAIKARGIRIAILYLTYFPLTNDSWYSSHVAPYISQVSPNLQSCASSANLYSEVQTGGDITSALNQLFLNAVSSAPHLTQ